VDLGYVRVSTAKQDLDRQLHALDAVGIPAERTFVDEKSGSTTDRPGLRALLGYARDGDVIVVHARQGVGVFHLPEQRQQDHGELRHRVIGVGGVDADRVGQVAHPDPREERSWMRFRVSRTVCELRWRGFGCKSGAERIRTLDPLTASTVNATR
jgi:hypothetical protein